MRDPKEKKKGWCVKKETVVHKFDGGTRKTNRHKKKKVPIWDSLGGELTWVQETEEATYYKKKKKRYNEESLSKKKLP